MGGSLCPPPPILVHFKYECWSGLMEEPQVCSGSTLVRKAFTHSSVSFRALPGRPLFQKTLPTSQETPCLPLVYYFALGAYLTHFP